MDEQLRAATEAFCARMAEAGRFRRASHQGAPTHREVAHLVRLARRVLFPGYYTAAPPLPLRQALGQLFTAAARLAAAAMPPDHPDGAARGQEIAYELLEQLPEIKALLDDDVRAAYEGDPAAKSPDEVIFSYPGLLALTLYRLAHALERLETPYVPRMMTELAHSRTGIDIHPGARIGRSFFIDHGTGVVIGETTRIGDRVRLYQGVTLGALSLPRDAGERYRNLRRHPTIEDDVIIYANTTILGGTTVIGARSIIGGNNWITESVPPDTRVTATRPQLTFTPRS